MIAHATSRRTGHINAEGRDEMLTARRAPFTFDYDAAGTSDGIHVHLTPRQLEVLALLCEGLPNKLICRRLNISAGTAKAHISSILRELGVSSRLQAVVEASRQGLAGYQGAEVSGLDTRTDDQLVMPVNFACGANGRALDYSYSRN